MNIQFGIGIVDNFVRSKVALAKQDYKNNRLN